MKNHLTTLLSIILLALLAGNSQSAEPTLRVMSFNIRFGTANDGDNSWQHRDQLVVETIRRFDPDLLGTQETLAFQAKYLNEQLPHFQRIGRSREAIDGPDGEQCTIYFKRDRFELVEHRHVWLSETPEVPGSKSWDSSLPRMATWVKLRDKKSEKLLYLVNTHFDHRGSEARLESAKLLRKLTGELGKQHRVILTGDFNCGEGSEPHQALFGNKSPLTDSYRAAHPQRGDKEGTFNGFRGRDAGARIDWIATGTGLTVTAAQIDRFNKDGQYPSDHFPVTAVVE